jgi:Cu(I)/Ag(I) efflux system membrane fusion protein
MKRALIVVAVVVVIAVAIAFIAKKKPSDEVTQDGSGRRVVAWVDPMRSMGPPHTFESKHPGVAPDCGMKLVPVYAETAKTTSAVELKLDTRVAVATRRDLSRSLRTSGRVTIDERSVSQVHTKFEGFADALYVNVTGQLVRKGDPLLAIYSPDLLATQNELLVAQRNPTDLGRMLTNAARARLRLWDMSDGDVARLMKSGTPTRDVVLRSPASGVVMTKNAVAGARVMPSDTLYEIADLSRVWVVADVYESELPYIHVGSSAQVVINGRTIDGKISFITPVLAAPTRTASVRIELENRDGSLRPDTFAEVILQEPVGNVLAVPDSAVMNTGARTVVYVQKSDGNFNPRSVVVGAKTNGFYEIRSGLDEGDRVAADANFLVDSESRLPGTRQ